MIEQWHGIGSAISFTVIAAPDNVCTVCVGLAEKRVVGCSGAVGDGKEAARCPSLVGLTMTMTRLLIGQSTAPKKDPDSDFDLELNHGS